MIANQLASTDVLTPQPQHDFLAKFQVSIPSAISELNSVSSCSSLEDSYAPTEYDVVCGRGKGSYNRPGNKRLRSIIQHFIPRYVQSKSKLDKTIVLGQVIDEVRKQSNGMARFVKHNKSGWTELGRDEARAKVGHAMREAIGSRKMKGRIDPPKQLAFQKTISLLNARQLQELQAFAQLQQVYQVENLPFQATQTVAL